MSPETVEQIPDDVWELAGKAMGSPDMNRDLVRRRVANAIMADRSRRPSSEAGKGEALPTVERVVSGDSHYMCFKNYPRGAWSLEIPKDVQDFFEEWAARNAALQPGHKP